MALSLDGKLSSSQNESGGMVILVSVRVVRSDSGLFWAVLVENERMFMTVSPSYHSGGSKGLCCIVLQKKNKKKGKEGVDW